MPYWGPFLADRGFNEAQIGSLIALIMATKIIAPNVWGWVADHYGHRMRLVRVASLFSALIFSGIFLADSFWQLAALMVFFSFFWNASLPQVEVLTLSHLGENKARYGRIRLWGSVGFIVTVLLLGWLVEYHGTGVVPKVVLLLYVLIWLSAMLMPEEKAAQFPVAEHHFGRLIRQPQIFLFLLVCFLLQASHGAYYGFYSLYMEQAGYSTAMIGVLWALGVLAEVVLFIIMPRLLQRLSAVDVLLASIFLASLRWLLTALFVDSWAIMISSQLLHAATFGSFHAAAIHMVHDYFPGKVQGRGQALYSSLSFGAGGALGAWLSGHLWLQWGAASVFYMAATMAFLGLLVGLAGRHYFFTSVKTN